MNFVSNRNEVFALPATQMAQNFSSAFPRTHQASKKSKLGVLVAFAIVWSTNICISNHVLAQVRRTTESAQTRADAIIEEGVRAREQQNDARGLELFVEANRLFPSARAMAQIALAEQALGDWVSAATHMEEALLSDDRWIRARRSALREAQRTIDRHVGRLRVLSGEAGSEIRIGHRVLATLPMNRAVFVLVGTHSLELWRCGSSQEGVGPIYCEEIAVRGGESIAINPVVSIQQRGGNGCPEQAPPPPPVSDAEPLSSFIPPHAIHAPRSAGPSQSNDQAIAGWILVGSGIALASAGTVFWFVGENIRNGHLASPTCQPDLDNSREGISRYCTLSNWDRAVGFAAGGWALGAASLGTGILLLLTQGSPSNESTTDSSALEFSCIPGLTSIACSMRF